MTKVTVRRITSLYAWEHFSNNNQNDIIDVPQDIKHVYDLHIIWYETYRMEQPFW